MTTERKEYSASDAAPVILYVKDDPDSQKAYPLVSDMLNPGFAIPEHDYVGITWSGSTMTQVIYKINGSTGSTVATLDITYNGLYITSVSKS